MITSPCLAQGKLCMSRARKEQGNRLSRWPDRQRRKGKKKKYARAILEALRIVVHYPLGGASHYHDHYAWRSPSRKHFVFVTNRNGQSGRPRTPFCIMMTQCLFQLKTQVWKPFATKLILTPSAATLLRKQIVMRYDHTVG
jgi:hypothetical protein